MIRIALIGCGDHSQRYHAAPLARYLAENPGQIRLCSACDLDGARAKLFCEQFGFERSYTDWRKMLDAEKPDTCLAIVPSAATGEIGANLLERGIPVVLEKPLGDTIEGAHRLAEIARKTGTKHIVSMNRRFMPLLNRGLAWARQQSGLRFLRCTMLRNRRVEPDFIWSTGVHAIDAMRYIAGDIEHHTVVTRDAGNPAVRWHFVGFDFKNGCLGEFHSCPTAGTSCETYEMFGDNFAVQFECFVPNVPNRVRCWREGKLEIDESAKVDEADFVTRGEYAELTEWISALRDDRPAGPVISDVLQSMEIGFTLASETR